MTLAPANSHGSGYPLGLTGATAATRYVGGTASGAPVAGTFAVGDFIIDRTGKVYVCTVAGTPGTWTQVGGSSPTTAFIYAPTGSGLTLSATDQKITWDSGSIVTVGAPGWTLNGDNQTWNCGTTGIYSVVWEISVISADVTTNLVAQVALSGTGDLTDGLFGYFNMAYDVLIYPNANLAYQLYPQVFPPFTASAGDTMFFNAKYRSRVAGSASVGSDVGNFAISKVA